MNYLTGFFGGLVTIMMAILPVAILWAVLTGGSMFGMDVIANLGDLVNACWARWFYRINRISNCNVIFH